MTLQSFSRVTSLLVGSYTLFAVSHILFVVSHETKWMIGYWQRWMVENFFFGFKMLFGGVVNAKRFERMVKGIELKERVYNLMVGLTVAVASVLSGAKG